MGIKLNGEQLRIYKSIDEILWKNWDPIGVSEFEEARDEYYGYLPQVFQLKIKGADKNDIAKYLYKIETENMTCDGNFEHCKMIADQIMSL